MRLGSWGAAYVGGRWVESDRTFPVYDPATGERLAEVAALHRADVEKAIEAARDALPGWAGRTAHDRGAMLRRWAGLLLAHQEELAAIMTAEQGKPLAEARGEVAFSASFMDWFAEEGKRSYGEVIPSAFGGKRYHTLRQPAGVAAAITPWNFPAAMLARKAAAALAAGCTMVAKPAAETPICALYMAKLAEEAGIPPGVLNVVTSDDAAEIGDVFCSSPVVRVLSFTGSTGVGKRLYRQSGDTMKRLALELGGNAPVLVFDDADLDLAIENVLASKYRNAGQTCVSANRIFVQANIHDRFVEQLTRRVEALKVGPGSEAGVAIGPLISGKAVAKVEALVKDALSKGAVLVTGGGRHAAGPNFFQPTVLTNIQPGMALLEEEIFGPVAPIIRFADENEGLSRANETSVGLAAYAFTRDLARSIRVSEGLQCGIVAINDGLPSVAVAPFGGVKDSGLGREGGRQGLDEYLDIKFVCVGTS